jgi:hypothetical protein
MNDKSNSSMIILNNLIMLYKLWWNLNYTNDDLLECLVMWHFYFESIVIIVNHIHIWLIVQNFSPHSTFFQLYDCGQFLLVEERTQMDYTLYLGRNHRPSSGKLTNFLAQSHQSEQDLNWRRLEVRYLVIWDRRLNHSTTEGPHIYICIHKLYMLWCMSIMY